MPIYKDQIIEELENKQEEFKLNKSRDNAEDMSDKLQKISREMTAEQIRENLADIEFPGALPTQEFDSVEKPVIEFNKSNNWESHEATNNWAKSILSDVVSVSADGSQVDPIDELEQPVGMVQVVWMENHHSEEKDYRKGADTEVLTPEDLVVEDPETGMEVDGQKVPFERFRKEAEALENKIAELDDQDKTGVVFYDGPLIPSYIKIMDESRKKKYIEALARLMAASEHHKVPLVGYVSGSKATEISKMIQHISDDDHDFQPRDKHIMEQMFDKWGDRSPIFEARRDRIQKNLKATYKNHKYKPGNNIVFTYLKTGSKGQIDRLELPGWIHESGQTEEVINAVRAETGVGRGYPEILQAVDADAVISKSDRQEFLEMFIKYAEQIGIELNVNNKALSKERRRR